MSVPAALRDDHELLTGVVRDAGVMALRFFQGGVKSWHKKPNDPVSEADIAVDQMLHDRLTADRPDYSWLSEESGQGLRSGRHRWIVDPIDGTRAFIERSEEPTPELQSLMRTSFAVFSLKKKKPQQITT